MANLFNPLVRRLNILSQIEENDGVLTPELEELLTVSDDRIQEVTSELLHLRQVATTQIMAAEAQVAQAKEFAGRIERVRAAIDSQLKDAAIRLGTIQAGTYKISIGISKVADVYDPELLPRQWQREVPAVAAQWLPDKVAIAKALRAGNEVPGARLEERQNLQIK